MIEVSQVRLNRDEGGNILSGLIDGEELWLRFPLNVEVALRGEPFLGIALMFGMSRGEDVAFVDAPLDPSLMRSLAAIQSLLCLWNPHFRRVSVKAAEVPVPRLNPGVLASFSGGIDSSCTLIEHMSEISHLMTMNGFDEAATPHDFEALRTKNQAIAEEFGKVFVPIESNGARFARKHHMALTYVRMPLLCLTACSLGFDRFLIPSSYVALDIKPWGSHPVLDPLWSSGTTTIIHDGAHHRRTEKSRIVASHPEVFKHLQVCWRTPTSNCGECSKCARTLLALRLLGHDEGPIPLSSNQELVRSLRITSDDNSTYVRDLLRLAREQGDMRIAALLQRNLRRYGVRKNLWRAARHLAGPRLLTRWQRLRRPGHIDPLVRIIDPDDVV